MKIYVGNLSKDASEDDVKALFSTYGNVDRVKIIKDMFSGESKGFGFIDMPGNAEAQKAMNELNTTEFKGKKLIVNEARPQTDRKGGSNRGGSGFGSRGGNSRGGNSFGGGNRRNW